MNPTYEPSDLESRWYSVWEQAGVFRPEINPDGEPYCIVIPPPNITGSLHIGHAFNNTLQDILIRWRRMQGYNTLWQPGTDHAGIATQNVVEKQLHAEGTDREDLGRDEFIKRVWKWRDESGGAIRVVDVRHRHAPVRHRAVRIDLRDLAERALRFEVPEAV